MFSQPIIELSTRDVFSEELLVRIAADNGPLIRPGSFMPVAEEHGLVPAIDRFMIERAAKLAGCGRPVSVNLSAATIADDALFSDIIASIHRHNADPQKITFEVTETAVPSDMVEATILTRRLVARGFRIALDDFGSGWGALQYLQALPVSIIKIDCDFVRGLAENPRNVRLVEAIVALAGVLGHRVVAEGIENERAMELLITLGVDYGQGFHIGAPAPVRL